MYQNTTTVKRQQELEGCRYSVLLDLPYFDPVRMTIIDPMHNLYLGTAKHNNIKECLDETC